MKHITKAFIGAAYRRFFQKFSGEMKIIIMYHRVADILPKGMYDPHMFVTSSSLEMHIREIKKNFKIVPLDKLLQINNDTKRSCVITFDDGWKDNYDVAFPILRQANIPATIFLPTDNIGTSHYFWFEHLFYLANFFRENLINDTCCIDHFKKEVRGWSPLKLSTSSILQLVEILKCNTTDFIIRIIENAYNKFKIDYPSENILVDWAHVNEMGGANFSFGSHGLQHDIFPLLNSRLKRDSVFCSLDTLKRKTDFSIPFFCYPNGNWDEETLKLLKSAGYHGATTTINGCVGSMNPYLLCRIGLTEHSSNTKNLLWFQLASAFLKFRGNHGLCSHITMR